MLREAAQNPEPFWEALVADIGLTWLSPYRSVLGAPQHAPATRWFHGGKLNIAVDAVDKWAQSSPKRVAIVWEAGDGKSRTLTTQQLKSEVCRVARGLADLGVRVGDRVAIDLPAQPEAVVAMLAAVRIGAVIVSVACASASKRSAACLEHCDARVVFCTDGFLQDSRENFTIGKRREIFLVASSIETIVVVPGSAPAGKSASRSIGLEGRTVQMFDYESLGTLSVQGGEVVGMNPSDPILLAYGNSNCQDLESLVHTHSGFAIKSCQDMDMSFDVQPGDCLMWLADLGWDSGFEPVLGALALGATIVLVEDLSENLEIERMWRAVERYGVTHLVVSANVVQRSMNAEPTASERCDLSRLRIFGATGEDWDAASWRWLFEVVGKRKRPIVRHSNSSGTSGGILGSFAGLPTKRGSFSGPLPGVSAEVWDRNGRPVRGEIGDLVILKPWPWMTRRQLESHSRLPGADRQSRDEHWFHGTHARIDDDGFWFDHGTSDRRE